MQHARHPSPPMTLHHTLIPIQPPPQVPRPLHQLLILMFLHLQFPLPLHRNQHHLHPPRCSWRSPHHLLLLLTDTREELAPLSLQIHLLPSPHTLQERRHRSSCGRIGGRRLLDGDNRRMRRRVRFLARGRRAFGECDGRLVGFLPLPPRGLLRSDGLLL